MTIEEFNDIYIQSITNYKPLRKGKTYLISLPKNYRMKNGLKI